jgi:hypothetical protein
LVPGDIAPLLGEEAELFHVSLHLRLQLGQVLGAAALHLLRLKKGKMFKLGSMLRFWKMIGKKLAVFNTK